ncbi:carboxypeptidase-like regulatory domain-containing protein [Polaribacter sp. PL03]|uniref:carboxypeptidase-like regulatory domain-containing protein n=1 Tax=Polaribacter sp. PL03 TaxID=3088353 RepID=UPI0029D19A31|nr:carboxypeptidase-like regulatory domain-containing protein [Polaribacter sp. PL03]MDX6745811.1 carboxypeptidase-like regulatory domain-containing protein [Polaribacter sp. PL03]
MKKTLLIILFIISFSSYSQKKSFFFGKIIDSSLVVKDAHIINIKTNKGTFSNDNGVFKISANENDSLQITSIGYKTRFIKVKSFHLREKENLIFIKEQTYNLKEIVLKRTELTGSLSLDIKKTPKNYKEEAVEKLLLDLKNMDYSAISKMPLNAKEMHLTKPTATNLPGTFVGLGISIGGKSSINEQKPSLNKLEEEQEVAIKIYSLLGENFFLKELKIPKEKYNNFLIYCSFKGTTELYKNNNILKLIKVLKEESIGYLKL